MLRDILLGILLFTLTGLLGFLARQIIKKVMAMRREKKLLEEHRDRQMRIIEEIAAQLQPNGGTSLADHVTKIDDNLATLSARMAALDSRSIAIQRRQQFSDQVMRSILDASGMAFWESNEAGETVYASQRLAEMIGCSPPEVLGRGWVTFLHPQDKEQVVREWREAVQEKRGFAAAYRYLHRNGRVVKVHGRSVPLVNENDEIIGHSGTLTLVTE